MGHSSWVLRTLSTSVSQSTSFWHKPSSPSWWFLPFVWVVVGLCDSPKLEVLEVP